MVDKPPRTSQPLFDYNYHTLAFLDPQLTPFTSLFDLNTETNTISSSSLIEKSDLDIFFSALSTSFIKIVVYI